jgi:phospholipid/cholesterol/gamma-HCH transport system ATP-binding protein
MSEPTDILEFHDVTIAADGEAEPSLCNFSACVAAGDLAVVLLLPEQVRIPLADAAEGLVAPVRGMVTFLGEDWQTMAVDRAAAQRGKIGRLFEGESWLGDLDVDQDITLAQRHHTRRAVKEIEAEASQLCQVFGLAGLPRGRPAGVRWQDLQRAACVRACLGTPVLILLGNPTRDLHADVFAPLIKALHDARQRGAAVLWTTAELRVWNHPELCATTRYRMLGPPAHMMAEEKGAT